VIVHLFNSSSVSGPERLVLPALAGFPHEFTIVNLREQRIDRLRDKDPLEDYSRSLNLHYASVRVKKRWDRRAMDELRDLLIQLRPDLVHAHAIKASIYLFHAKRKFGHLSFPIVSTHHGIHGLPDLKVRLYEWIYRRRYLKLFDRVLCVSSADYDDLLNSGIDRDKIRLHLNGINGNRIDCEHHLLESKRIRALWMPQDAGRDRLFLFGVIGRLSQEKDHARVLKILARLNRLSGEKDWKCLIFGAGAMEQDLRRQAIQLGLQDKVLWMGYRNEVGNELAGLDLLLSFSKAEGLPINVIEAGWAGTSVMATWVGGVKDLIPDDDFGFRVLPNESVEESARRLQTLLSDPGQRKLQALGSNLQERVIKHFTQEKWLQRLGDIYSELNVSLRRHSHAS
jgi:glycosyltransferase involved in cell wall biosynthesis